MAALQQFIAAPKNFLWKGPLLIDEDIALRPPSSAASYDLRFDIAETQHSATHKSFKVREVPHGGQQAFYLPWKNDVASVTRLDNSRSFFFTAELSGCIFVIERGGGDRPRVLHIGVNLAAQKTTLIANNIGGSYYAYESDQDEVATALGYRTANGWTFHVQRRSIAYQPVRVRSGQVRIVAPVVTPSAFGPPTVTGGGLSGVHIGARDFAIPGQVRDIYTYNV